jgi:hypothetical protein
MNIVDYHIEEWNSSRILQQNVKQKIREGWQPLGGISIALRNDYTHAVIYAQAMIRQHNTIAEGRGEE